MKSLLLGAVCALFLSTAQAASVTLSPVSLGTAEDQNKDGTFDTMSGGLEASSTGANETYRGLLEFDLSAVSGNVTSATLSLWTTFVGGVYGAPAVEVHGYAGNGVVELSDAVVDNLITTVTVPGSSVLLNVNVTPFVQTLPTYAGFMLRQVDETIDIHAGFGFIDPQIPTLTINYSPVPIPPALYLFGSGLLGLAGMARRKTA